MSQAELARTIDDAFERRAEIGVTTKGAVRVLRKAAEAAFPEADPPHLGLSMDDIGLSGRDLLAEKLLASGDDPDPAAVKSAAPPQGSKIRQVVVPCASTRPSASVSRPSAVPTRRPRLMTRPSALMSPVSGVTARTSEILNSSVV